MKLTRLLIANRGEIAIRIAEAAAAFGIESVAVYAEDDSTSLHRYRADRAVALSGSGAAAYLDSKQLIAVAREEGCDAVHPGYGFLSEDPSFALDCAASGLVFVGPPPEALALFADKASARQLAESVGVPVIEGSPDSVTLVEAETFLAGLEPGAAMMIKAVAGGGGRGMRIVRERHEIGAAYAEASAEAKSAFGNGALFVERFLPAVRHIEIQVVADAIGTTMHLGERECSLQRRHQKLVEIAPCPGITNTLRERIADAAMRLAREAGYRNVGTFEFLVDAEALSVSPEDAPFWFMEANPRIQVEHTVTELVTGVDLVQTQLAIAAGAHLAELGLDTPPRLSGHAIQARINLETMDADGTARAAAGTIERYELPSGPGVRVDGYGYAGFTASPRYDGLLAKLIVHTPGPLDAALAKARRALAESRVTGVDTNIAFLRALLARDELSEGTIDTHFVDRTLPALVAAASALTEARLAPIASHLPKTVEQAMDEEVASDCVLVRAPMQGLIVELNVAEGSAVAAGATLAVVEAMKMMHPITAPVPGVVMRIGVSMGAIVVDNAPMIEIALGEDVAASEVSARTVDLDSIPPELAELEARRALGFDTARAEAVAKRHALGHRTARENIADLTDPGSFVEYGPLAIAAQSRRRSEEDLIRNTQADGIVTGTATVNATQFGAEGGRCAVLAYDYMTLAGTQGHRTHHKMDRLLTIAERNRLPVVLFSEGGGGRPGDIDVQYVTGLQVESFHILARLSGLVPLIGINAGRCFAGNAALLGCCDVIIATQDSSIGMGGPAMIEGGGLGRYQPDEVGPTTVQVPNGVIDILVEDEVEAVAVAKRYLSYFQGPLASWESADQRLLRHALPQDRAHSYDIRALIATLADAESVLEIRRGYGAGIITALARIEGRPVGIIANNPLHLGGAIDAPAADKASRFFQLLDAHDIPLLSLCDTPGFMVGPESEKTAAVRRFSRLFVTAAGMDIPVMTIVLRKAYGLGAMAMMAGQSHVPEFTVAWPTGEFGGMGLEGAIRLGLRKELEAIEDPEQRESYFREQVAAAYRWGRAANAASHFEIDDVIDPADSRRWIVAGLEAAPRTPIRQGKKRSHIDSW